VDCAATLPIAIAQLRAHRPDLILLDLLMPEAEGFEVCEVLKAHPDHRDIPVTFMTGNPGSEEKLRDLEKRAAEGGAKPVDPTETLARVRRHLGFHPDPMRRTKTELALQTSLGKSLIVASPTGEILFCGTIAATLLRTHMPEMVSNLLPRHLVKGGTAGSLELELVPSPEAKDCVLLTLQVARPPASFRDLLSLGLTPRETEILYWVAQGESSSETGTILSISINTVKKHVQHILPKLGVETRLSAALLASAILSRLHAPAQSGAA
jgi:DNA-binding NarL/FixJ family response regulator